MCEPVPFSQANIDLTAPSSMPDVLELPAFKNGDEYISKWRLTTAEIAEISRTGHIYLHVLAAGHPPVKISTVDPF